MTTEQTALLFMILAGLMLSMEYRIVKLQALSNKDPLSKVRPKVTRAPVLPIKAYLFPDNWIVFEFANGKAASTVLEKPPKGDYVLWDTHRVKVERREYGK